MSHQKISVSINFHVAWVDLNLGNTLVNEIFVGHLQQVIDQLEDANSVRVIVFQGLGSLAPSMNPVANLIANAKKPTIALISQDCFDHSLEIALACDIRIASTTSNFALRHLLYGILPNDGATQRLPRIVGRSQSLFLLLTSQTIPASRAIEIGLVQQIAPVSKIKAIVENTAEAIAKGGPIAIAYTKEAILNSTELTLNQGLVLEQDLSLLLYSTKERAEGLSAFREKRAPKFGGE